MNRRSPGSSVVPFSSLPDLAPMVTHDYHEAMKSVGTAQLKAHLSEHLRAVRQGETITVLDRDQPIARIVPVRKAGSGLVVHEARGSIHDIPILPPLPLGKDVVEALLEERADRR